MSEYAWICIVLFICLTVMFVAVAIFAESCP
jgi:hypothetical protein